MVYAVPAGLNCVCIPLTEKKHLSLSKPLSARKGLPTQDIKFFEQSVACNVMNSRLGDSG